MFGKYRIYYICDWRVGIKKIPKSKAAYFPAVEVCFKIKDTKIRDRLRKAEHFPDHCKIKLMSAVRDSAESRWVLSLMWKTIPFHVTCQGFFTFSFFITPFDLLFHKQKKILITFKICKDSRNVNWLISVRTALGKLFC